MIDYVEPAFNGMMMILLKNGGKDFISRKYLPQLKQYLGI
jgi:DNA-binding LytR/AlgR family response regulator